MKAEKQQLLQDLLAPDSARCRQATLLAGTRILRRKRQRRAGLQLVFAVTLIGLAGLAIQRITAPGPRTFIAAPVIAPAAPPAEMKGLTDAELLALFPDTPIALVTLENGKKRLIFPRPEDAERFVAPL